MLPHYYTQTEPGWGPAGLVGLVPSRMLGDPSANPDAILTGFVRGMSSGTKLISPFAIPWHGWTTTLCFWLPVLFCFLAATMALAIVVHRQWSTHEHIPYPIVTFTQAILPTTDGRWSPVMRDRWFWYSMLAILLIHINNWACVWMPNYLYTVPIRLDFWPLTSLWPRLREAGVWPLMVPYIFLTVVALSYLLPTSVSLSFGLSGYIYVVVAALLLPFGVQMTGISLSQDYESYLHAGGYTAMICVLVYSGRHYYLNVTRRALFLRASDAVQPAETWAARLFILAFAALWIQFVSVGLDWQLALIWLAIAFVVLIVMARIVAETGAITVNPWITPCVLMVGFFGPAALGLKTILTLFVLSSVIMFDTTHMLMPFMANINKMVEMNRLRMCRVAVLGIAVLIVAIGVAVPVTLYWQYNDGALNIGLDWNRLYAPKYAYQEGLRIHDKLDAQGMLAVAGTATGWSRFLHIRPSGPHMLAFGIALVLTLGCAMARYRWAWWPLHPVFFLLLGTWQSKVLAFSFLLGWLIKLLTTKYGGHSAVQRLKPFMFGLVAGEVLACVLFMIYGACYYFITHKPPKVYSVYPM